jgi:hypothetical protein
MENAIGHQQKILSLYIWWLSGSGLTTGTAAAYIYITRLIPCSYVLKLQGNLGAGNTFILSTTCNITRNLFGKMDYDMVTVTTGFASELICGETHSRGYSTNSHPEEALQTPPRSTSATSPCRRRRPLCNILLGSSTSYLMSIP